MTITVSLKVSNERAWDTIADKSSSLEMPVSQEDANWKEAVGDKLQFFMQEASEMLIPAVKQAVDKWSPPREPEKLPPPAEEDNTPDGDGNAAGSIPDTQSE